MKIGKYNTLTADNTGPYGLTLSAADGEQVILPADETPADTKIGDRIKVFIYTDAGGDPRATLKTPLLTRGGTAALRVVAESDAGLWLDWGLSHDLLLPRSEQRKHRAPGSKTGTLVFVYLFLDETSGKLCATTRFHRHLSEDGSGYRAGQEVSLCIADKTDLGYRTIINEQTLGLLFADQTHKPLGIGEHYKGYIKRVREDGKVDVTLYATTVHQRSDLEEHILAHLKKLGGSSTLTDKSPPEDIYKTFKVSKKHYKRALGSLYKARLIIITAQQITLA